MAGPFEFLFGGGGGMEQPTADSPAYVGPRAGSGDFFGPAGLDYILGRPSPGQVSSYDTERKRLIDHRDEMDARDAGAFLMGKAAELQEANPQAMPNDLFKMLMQDQDARSKLLKIPAGKHGQMLKDIMERFQPTPPKYIDANPGSHILEQGQRAGQDPRKVHEVPLTPAQQGVGRGGPKVFDIKDNAGRSVGKGVLKIDPETGEEYLAPVHGAGGPRQYQHGAPQPAPPGQPTSGPPRAGGGPSTGAPRGQTMPGQAGGSFPPSPGPGMQVPPGQVTPDLGTPGLRKADMVDSFGWLGQGTRLLGGFSGNIDPKAQAAKQQQTHQLLQELRGSFLAMNGSTRLARELKAKEGLLPPESPGLDWNPYKGIDNLISLSQWTDQAMAHAESEINSPYASGKTVEVAQEDLVRLRNFRAALGPHEELVAKKQELAEGKGGTSWEELKRAIPGSETAERFFGQGLRAAQDAAGQARAAIPGQSQPAAPDVPIEQFTKTIRGLDTATFSQLAAERHLMTPEQVKAYSAEIARRKAEQNKGSLKVTPAPAPAAPKSQDRIPPSDPNPAGVRRQLPPGYRLPGDSEPDPR